MKLGAVSFPLTEPRNFDAWTREATRWLTQAAAEKVELLVFPEYFTLALESDAAFRTWFEADFTQLFSDVARKHRMTILAGTHNIGTNTAALFLPSGERLLQHKIHLIPSETDEEPLITAGSELLVVPFAHGKLATTICYDVEFPELTRAAVKAGVNLLLCPSWTEKADGFHRVRYCAHARAVENQLFLVHAPLVGSFAPWGVNENACGSAAILAPSDPAFPATGVLSEGPWSEAALVTAVVDFKLLETVRKTGAVRTWRDFMNPAPFEVKPC